MIVDWLSTGLGAIFSFRKKYLYFSRHTDTKQNVANSTKVRYVRTSLKCYTGKKILIGIQ